MKQSWPHQATADDMQRTYVIDMEDLEAQILSRRFLTVRQMRVAIQTRVLVPRCVCEDYHNMFCL